MKRRVIVPKVPVDFSEVQDFEPLEKGEYACMIEEIIYVEPQTEDKYPYLNVTLTVTEDGEYQNRKLWKVWSLSPKALFRMKQDLENLGVDVDDLEIDYDEDTMKVMEPDLDGYPCMVAVSQRPYEGRMTNQVDTLTAIDSPRVGEKKGAEKKSPAAKKAAAKKGSGKKFR
jgi:hypothetical protein